MMWSTHLKKKSSFCICETLEDWFNLDKFEMVVNSWFTAKCWFWLNDYKYINHVHTHPSFLWEH